MRIILYIILLIIVLLGATFAYLNADLVTFNYYLGERLIPLSLLLVLSLGVGLLLGIFVMAVSWIRLKKNNRSLKKNLKCAQQEVENLRAIPIQNSH